MLKRVGDYFKPFPHLIVQFDMIFFSNVKKSWNKMGTLKMGTHKKIQYEIFGWTRLSKNQGHDMTRSRQLYAQQNAEKKQKMEEAEKKSEGETSYR